MTRTIVSLTTILLLVTPGLGIAADLQAGWYVKLGLVALYGFDGIQERAVDWNFVGGLGAFPPFQVTSPDPVWARRMIAVPESVTGVPPGTGVYLWGDPITLIDFPVHEVVFYWETDYDAAQMRLQLLMYRQDQGYTPLWEQTLSNHHSSFTNVLGQFQVIPVGYIPVFHVTAVPETSALISLCSLVAALVTHQLVLCAVEGGES